MIHYFSLKEWKVSEIEKHIDRNVWPCFHKLTKGYLEYDDERNGCAFDHITKDAQTIIRNNGKLVHKVKHATVKSSR